MLKKLLIWLAVTVPLLLALAGHVVYHYLPRERPAVPRPGSPAAALFGSDEFPVVLWMPHPHQNLGFLRQAIGGGGATAGGGLRAVGRLAGLPSPALPSFGPLMVPPAAAMAVAADEGGERYAVVAEVHPAFAWFARLAGRLAGNPWLEGGEIYVEGRRAQVAWRGDLWVVASPEFPRALSEPPAGGDDDVEPALAVVRVRQAVHPLPAGRYRLVSRGPALEIVSSAPGAEPAVPDFDPLGLAELEAFLFVFSGRAEALGEPARALVCFLPAASGSTELPRFAAIHEPVGRTPGFERRSLPGESLLELSGRRIREGVAAGWSIAALDPTGFERAAAVAPRLDALAPAAGEATIAWALWLDLDAGLSEVSRIADLLAGLPIVPQRRLERWRDAAAILRPLAQHYSRVSAVITEDRAFRLRLEPRAGDGSDGGG